MSYHILSWFQFEFHFDCWRGDQHEREFLLLFNLILSLISVLQCNVLVNSLRLFTFLQTSEVSLLKVLVVSPPPPLRTPCCRVFHKYCLWNCLILDGWELRLAVTGIDCLFPVHPLCLFKCICNKASLLLEYLRIAYLEEYGKSSILSRAASCCFFPFFICLPMQMVCQQFASLLVCVLPHWNA